MKQQMKEEELKRVLSLLALPVQKYKYWRYALASQMLGAEATRIAGVNLKKQTHQFFFCLVWTQMLVWTQKPTWQIKGWYTLIIE